MPINEHKTIRVPPGMDNTADDGLAMDSRAFLMLGVSPKNPGWLEESLRKLLAGPIAGTNTWPAAASLDGIFEYNTATAATDKVVLCRGANVYTCTVSANQPQTVTDALKITMSDLTLLTNSSGITFTAGKRVRAVQHKNELYFVQDAGMLPIRYNGTALFKLGITPPAAPTLGATAAGVLNGVYNYYVTYEDELFRESSPSALVATGTLVNRQQTVNWIAPTDAQVQRIYLYRSNPGSTTLYRVVQAGFAIATVTYTDNNTDIVVASNTTIRVGQNDPPLSASLIAKYKNRVVLNSIADREAIQISNLDSPSQYPVIGNYLFPTDGQTFRVSDERGDEIVGFGNLGSGLGIMHRSCHYILQGSAPALSANGFQILRRGAPGCISSDGIQDCGGKLVWPAEDGIWYCAATDGFVPHKLSDALDADFESASVMFTSPAGVYPPTQTFTREARGAAAVSWYMQDRYYLAMPPWTYIYDFSAGEGGAWSQDYMTYLSDTNGQSGNKGYQCAQVIHVQRQYNVCLYAPYLQGSTGSGLGECWVGSYYPLVHPTAQGQWQGIYQTRGIDGAGVPRSTRKRAIQVDVFGEITVAPGGAGDPEGFNQISGTVTIDVDGGKYTESWPFDSVTQVSTNYAGANFARDQLEGKLFSQCFSVKAIGRIFMVRIQFVAIGRVAIRDVVLTYVRLDPN